MSKGLTKEQVYQNFASAFADLMQSPAIPEGVQEYVGHLYNAIAGFVNASDIEMGVEVAPSEPIPHVWYYKPITVARVVEIAESLASDEGDYQNSLLVELVSGFGVYAEDVDKNYYDERAHAFTRAIYQHTTHGNNGLYDYLMGLGVATEIGEVGR